eukprot:g9093.t1
MVPAGQWDWQLKDLGCFVVGSAGTVPGLAAVRAGGADLAVEHRQEGYLEKSLEAVPSGFDVILAAGLT